METSTMAAMLAPLAILVAAVTASAQQVSDPLGLIAVAVGQDAQAQVLAVSQGGNAGTLENPPAVGIADGGTAAGGYVAVGTGDAWGGQVGIALQGKDYDPGLLEIGWGGASGLVAVSGQGCAAGAVGVSLNCAGGAAAVSGTGCAYGQDLAVSVSGCADDALICITIQGTTSGCRVGEVAAPRAAGTNWQNKVPAGTASQIAAWPHGSAAPSDDMYGPQGSSATYRAGEVAPDLTTP